MSLYRPSHGLFFGGITSNDTDNAKVWLTKPVYCVIGAEDTMASFIYAWKGHRPLLICSC